MKHRLYIIEGLPCSGKSTTSTYVAELLKQQGNVCFVDEGTGDHPADYEFHALAPAGLISDEVQIVSLKDYSGELFDQLLQYKIYDFLPWETEKPVILEKWRQFAREAQEDTIYVFNCVLLQNPMCETMMRFGFSEEESRHYIAQIAEIIRPLNPVVVYLKNEDIAASVRKAADERPGWLEGVIDYHVQGAYGKSIGAEDFDGYIQCLTERQNRELRILSTLPVESHVLENPQRDWKAAHELLATTLKAEVSKEIWDAYLSDGTFAGCNLVRGEPIPNGLYHLVSEILVRHTDGDYLLMQRDSRKPNYGGFFEATAGGSALKGEDALTCAKRELLEETGIATGTLTNIGRFVSHDTIYENFLCVTDCKKNSVKLQEGETVSYKWISEADFIAFVNSDAMIDVQFQRYLPYLKQMGYIK